LSWEEKFRLDVHYVDHHTFMGDLLILLGTVRSVVGRVGISQDGEVTSSEFMGSEPTATEPTATAPTATAPAVQGGQ
jgi:hypothetical protein